MPASSAAWMVAIDRSSSGRPSIDIGIPPRPIALTWTSPIVRVEFVMPSKFPHGNLEGQQEYANTSSTAATESGAVDVRVAVLHDVRRARADRRAGRLHVRDDAEVRAPLLLVDGDADVAPLAVEELEVRVRGQELLALIRHVGAVAAAGDRRTDELGADRGG